MVLGREQASVDGLVASQRVEVEFFVPDDPRQCVVVLGGEFTDIRGSRRVVEALFRLPGKRRPGEVLVLDGFPTHVGVDGVAA